MAKTRVVTARPRRALMASMRPEDKALHVVAAAGSAIAVLWTAGTARASCARPSLACRTNGPWSAPAVPVRTWYNTAAQAASKKAHRSGARRPGLRHDSPTHSKQRSRARAASKKIGVDVR